MTTTEKYWGDVSIYSVVFAARPDSKLTRKFRKILVFPSTITKEDIFHLVPVYFYNIEEVLFVEEVVDGLLLKEQQPLVKKKQIC